MFNINNIMTKVIGIDLGTTFSAIASLDDLGNPEVLTSIEDNRKITASAIYINDKNVVVGDKALNFIASEPNKVILQTKREMENDVVYSINKGNWTNDKDDIESYSPAQVSALILKKLKEYTSDVKRAVITVPAMFAERARQATLEAAKIADIEVIELINEPTAAVLHYASLPGVEIGGRVLIFDLGGGTFDVTIADVKSKSVDVLTSRGDKYLGGKDFDFEITKLMKKKYQEHHDVEIDIENNKEYPYKILVYPNETFQKDLEKDSYVVVLKNVIKELNKVRNDIYWTILTSKHVESLQFENTEQLEIKIPSYPNKMRTHFDADEILKVIDWRNKDYDIIYSHLPEQTLALSNLFKKKECLLWLRLFRPIIHL